MAYDALTPEGAEAKARELLDSRIRSVRELVAKRQEVLDARETLARLESEDAKVYKRALDDGWSADELRKIGLDSPTVKKTRTRRRSAKSTDTHPSEQAPSEPDATP